MLYWLTGKTIFRLFCKKKEKAELNLIVRLLGWWTELGYIKAQNIIFPLEQYFSTLVLKAHCPAHVSVFLSSVHSLQLSKGLLMRWLVGSGVLGAEKSL